MRVEALTPSLAARYDEFLLSRPETLLYQSWRYQSLLMDLLGCLQRGLLVLDSDSNVLAALPLMAMDGPYGTVLNSLPFYGSNGAMIGDDSAARNELAVVYRRMLQEPGMAASVIIENPLGPSGADGFDYDLTDERIGQLTRLPSSDGGEAALMQSLHYKTRNMIRKADRLGVEVIVDNNSLPFLADVHEENMRAIGGIAKPRRFFEVLTRHFRPNQDYRVYVASVNGRPVAGVLVFFFNRTAEYYTPVVLKDYRDSQALSAAIFRAMCDAAKQGYVWWNWGGTWLTQGGVYRFKSRWGTQDMRYRYFIAVHNPAVLRASRGELLAGYPSFFTVPFSALST
jgi:hypothetical protein